MLELEQAKQTVRDSGMRARFGILEIGEEGGKYEEGTGKMLAMLTCNSNEEMQRACTILNARRDVQLALDVLCRHHIFKELWACKDTTLQEFFVDGCLPEHSLNLRMEMFMCRISRDKVHNSECGDSIFSRKYEQGLIKSVKYRLQFRVPCNFEVLF